MSMPEQTPARRVNWIRIVGAVLIPALIAACIIGATWKFSQRLSSVKAAIVNHDEMITVNDQKIPMGRQLAAELTEQSKPSKDEPNITWKLMNEEGAKKGIRSGEFAVVVTIPKSFSADAMSFATQAPRAKQASIAIEKSEIASSIDPTLANVIINQATAALNKTLTSNYLNKVYEEMGKSGKKMNDLAQAVDQVSSANTQLAQGADQAKDGALQLSSGLDQASSGAARLSGGVNQLSQGNTKFAQGLHTYYNVLNSYTNQQNAQAFAQQHVVGQASGPALEYARTNVEPKVVAEIKRQMAAQAQMPAGNVVSVNLSDPTIFASAAKQVDFGVQQCVAKIKQKYPEAGFAEQVCGELGTQAKAAMQDPRVVEAVNTHVQPLINNVVANAIPTMLNSPMIDKLIMGSVDGGIQAGVQVGVNAGATAGVIGGATIATKGLETKDATSGQSLLSAADELARGSQQLSGGAQSLSSGLSQAAEKTPQLASGLGELGNGARKIADGSNQISTGIKNAPKPPEYTATERETLANAVAEPVQSLSFADIVNQNRVWPLAWLLAGLWLGALTVFSVLRPVGRRFALDNRPFGQHLIKSLLPGLIMVEIQAVLLAAIAQIAFRLPMGRCAALTGVLMLAGVSFAVVNHALVAWLGGPGRIISAVMLAVTAATVVTGAAPGAFTALAMLSPVTPAFNAAKAVVGGGTGASTYLLAVLGWGALAVLFSLGAILKARHTTTLAIAQAKGVA